MNANVTSEDLMYLQASGRMSARAHEIPLVGMRAINFNFCCLHEITDNIHALDLREVGWVVNLWRAINQAGGMFAEKLRPDHVDALEITHTPTKCV